MFFQIAKTGKNALWMYILNFFLIQILAGIIGGVIILLALLVAHLTGSAANIDFSAMDIVNLPFSSNVNFLLLASVFVFELILLYFCVKIFHKRKFLTVLTARKSFDIRRFFAAFLLWIVFLIVYFFIDISLYPQDYTFQFKLLPFLGLLLITLLFIPIQAGFEEILFRGYLMQGIGLATRSRFLSVLITSVVFGLMHSFNPEVQLLGFWNVMPYYIGFGVVLGLFTIWDNGLELAIGIHTATNIFLALVVTSEDSAIHTNAIFKLKELTIDMEDYLVEFICFVLIFIIFKHIYRWKNLKKIILPIER